MIAYPMRYRVPFEYEKFILNIMSEACTKVNTVIKDSDERRCQWNIVKTEDKKLLSRFGEFSYKSTTFVNKQTCKNEKLSDRYLGVEPHERLTEGVKVNILKEAVPNIRKLCIWHTIPVRRI